MRFIGNIAFIYIFSLVFPQLILSENFYLDDGGSSISLIVVTPSGESLAAEDEFVLDYIQNLLTANFNKYTAIKTNKQDTSENERTEASYLLISKLTKSGNVFILEMSVSDPSSGLRKASYIGANISANEILNAAAINNGFLETVKQLGVALSEEGIAAVKNPTTEEVQAAINLARGDLAEKSGNHVEMLTYLYNAVSYDPDLLEAGTRIDVFSKMLSSGDVGSAVKNDLKDYDKWKKILDEFDTFFQTHPPFVLTYNPHPLKKGHTDYDNRTAILEFELIFQEDVSFYAMQKVYTTITSGLQATGNREIWGFTTRPMRSPLFGSFRKYEIRAELLNSRDEVVGTATFPVRSRIALLRNTLYADTTQKTRQSFKPIHIENDLTDVMLVQITGIDKQETEKAMREGYVKILPAEELPKTKARNPLIILTRSIFDK